MKTSNNNFRFHHFQTSSSAQLSSLHFSLRLDPTLTEAYCSVAAGSYYNRCTCQVFQFLLNCLDSAPSHQDHRSSTHLESWFSSAAPRASSASRKPHRLPWSRTLSWIRDVSRVLLQHGDDVDVHLARYVVSRHYAHACVVRVSRDGHVAGRQPRFPLSPREQLMDVSHKTYSKVGNGEHIHLIRCVTSA